MKVLVEDWYDPPEDPGERHILQSESAAQGRVVQSWVKITQG